MLLIAAMLPWQPVAAQFAHTTHDARSGAMGGVFLVDSTRRAVVAWRQDFMLAGMADKRVAAVIPTGTMGFATAEYNHHGDAAYGEQWAAVGYVLRAAGWLRVGVQGRWMSIGVADSWYEPQHWLGADVLASAQVGRAELLVLAGTRPWDEARPWRAVAQMVYRPSAVWLTALAVESDDHVRMRCGMEYAYGGTLFFRAGVATNPMLASFGVGVKYGLMKLDIGAEMHSNLGVSPCCSIVVCF